jgi:hypothetical protein
MKTCRKFKFIGFGLGVVLLMAGFVACSAQVGYRLGREFTLSPGQSAQISGENIIVHFDAVTGDSRCPTGVT